MEFHLGQFAMHFLLSIAGLAIYSLWQVRDHLATFSMKTFVHDNRPFWIWAFSLQVIFALIIAFIPDAAVAIKTIVGIDLSEPMAFLVSGSMLASAANQAVKDRLGKKGPLIQGTVDPTNPRGPKT